MVTIIFESHSTTFDNEKEIASGYADAKLSPLGKKQAKQLGERHKNEHFDVIFCSDLSRSYETGEIAFEGKNVPIIKDKRLRECDYGDFTRDSSEKIKNSRKDYINIPFPNGESYIQTSQRMKSFLWDLLKDYNDKKVMIIGHRATQYGLEHWIESLPLKEVVMAPWKWQPGWTYKLNKV